MPDEPRHESSVFNPTKHIILSLDPIQLNAVLQALQPDPQKVQILGLLKEINERTKRLEAAVLNPDQQAALNKADTEIKTADAAIQGFDNPPK